MASCVGKAATAACDSAVQIVLSRNPHLANNAFYLNQMLRDAQI